MESLGKPLWKLNTDPWLMTQAGAINPETITQADIEHACEQARYVSSLSITTQPS